MTYASDHIESMRVGPAGRTPTPVTADMLPFNPGLDPKAPREGDTIYWPAPKDAAFYRHLGKNIWIPDGQLEFTIDINGDGQDELLRTYLLKTSEPAESSARGFPGRAFLCIYVRGHAGQWLRSRTFSWDSPIRSVELRKVNQDLRLLEVHRVSFGATSLETVCFISAPQSIRNAMEVPFVGGFLDGATEFVRTGSAGYGLSFALAADNHSITFRKFETLPARNLTDITYQLSSTADGRPAFVLLKQQPSVPTEPVQAQSRQDRSQKGDKPAWRAKIPRPHAAGAILRHEPHAMPP